MTFNRDPLEEKKIKQRPKSFSFSILLPKRTSINEDKKEDKNVISIPSLNSTGSINKSLKTARGITAPLVSPPSSSSRSSSSRSSTTQDSPHGSSPPVSSGRFSRASSSSSGCTSTKIEYSSAEILNNYTSDHKLLEILIRDNHLNYIRDESVKNGMGHHTINLNVEKKEYNILPMSNNILTEGIIELESVIEYELTLMPSRLKQMISFKCDEDNGGLNYSMIDMKGAEIKDFISYSALGDDFPHSNEVILAQEEKLLPVILQHTSKHTRLNKDGKKEGLHYRLMVNGREIHDFIPWSKLPLDFPIDEAEIIKEKHRTLPVILGATAQKAYTPLYSVETIVPDNSTQNSTQNSNLFPCYVLNTSEQIGGACGAGGTVIFAYEINSPIKVNLTDLDSILNYSAVVKIISKMSPTEASNLIETTKEWGQYLDNYFENKTLFLFTKPLIRGCNLRDYFYILDATKNKDATKHFIARRYVEPDQLIDRSIQIFKLGPGFYKKTKKLHLDQKTENYLISRLYELILIDHDNSQTEDEIYRKFERKNLKKDQRNSVKDNKKTNKKTNKKQKARKLAQKDSKFTYYGSPGYTLLEGLYGKKNEIFAICMIIAEIFSFLPYQTHLRAEMKLKEYIDDFTCDDYKKMLKDIFIDIFLMDEFRRDGIEHTWDKIPPGEIYDKYLAKRLKHIYPEDLDKLRQDNQQIINLTVALCYIYPRIIKEIIEPGTDINLNPEKRAGCYDNTSKFISIMERSKNDYYQLCTQEGRFKLKKEAGKLGEYTRDIHMSENKDEYIPEFKSSMH